jgi:hypothetical protein
MENGLVTKQEAVDLFFEMAKRRVSERIPDRGPDWEGSYFADIKQELDDLTRHVGSVFAWPGRD